MKHIHKKRIRTFQYRKSFIARIYDSETGTKMVVLGAYPTRDEARAAAMDCIEMQGAPKLATLLFNTDLYT